MVVRRPFPSSHLGATTQYVYEVEGLFRKKKERKKKRREIGSWTALSMEKSICEFT